MNEGIVHRLRLSGLLSGSLGLMSWIDLLVTMRLLSLCRTLTHSVQTQQHGLMGINSEDNRYCWAIFADLSSAIPLFIVLIALKLQEAWILMTLMNAKYTSSTPEQSRFLLFKKDWHYLWLTCWNCSTRVKSSAVICIQPCQFLPCRMEERR